MGFPLIKTWLDIKVFIDYDAMRSFMLEHGVPEKKLPNNRTVAGSVFSFTELTTKHKLLIVWIDAQWSSGLYIQATVAHEAIHALERIFETLGVRGKVNEEIHAQCHTSVYLEIARQLKDMGVDFNKPKPEHFPDE
jgi:hypothetical protein